jgi:hypothetical protein
MAYGDWTTTKKDAIPWQLRKGDKASEIFIKTIKEADATGDIETFKLLEVGIKAELEQLSDPSKGQRKSIIIGREYIDPADPSKGSWEKRADAIELIRSPIPTKNGFVRPGPFLVKIHNDEIERQI